jgi:hypothetical protein
VFAAPGLVEMLAANVQQFYKERPDLMQTALLVLDSLTSDARHAAVCGSALGRDCADGNAQVIAAMKECVRKLQAVRAALQRRVEMDRKRVAAKPVPAPVRRPAAAAASADSDDEVALFDRILARLA